MVHREVDQASQSESTRASEATTRDESQSEAASPLELQQRKNLIEAALYVSGRPLELKTLCSISGVTAKKRVQALVRELAAEYRNTNRAVEIVELEDGRFVMQLRSQFVSRVRRLSIRPLLTEGPLKTLSYIAYNQPILQAKVILARGQQAYEHIDQLLHMGLISKEKLGKSQMLKSTDIFADQFNLSRDFRLMKKQLESLFSSFPKSEIPEAREAPPSEGKGGISQN